MGLLRVDEKKCKRDGICAAECPRFIIVLEDDGSVPIAREGAEELCIRCGHCVTVCPHGAISLPEMKPENCPPLDKGKLLKPEEVAHVLRSRRSIRTYQDKEVDNDALQKLINIARYAPTGMNRQEVEWLVFHSRARVRELSGMAVDWMRSLVERNDPVAEQYSMQAIVDAWEAGVDVVCRGAPGLVVVHAPRDFGSAQTDCAIALSFLDVAAPSFGLGTCWAGFFMYALMYWSPLQKELAIPEDHAPFGAMMIGYPKYKYQRLPLRSEAKITWRG